jgi:hypothetical protein
LCLPSFADFALWRWAIRRRLSIIYHGLADDQLEAPELCVPFVSSLREQEKVGGEGGGGHFYRFDWFLRRFGLCMCVSALHEWHPEP